VGEDGCGIEYGFASKEHLLRKFLFLFKKYYF
jgi:hypothetical protein